MLIEWHGVFVGYRALRLRTALLLFVGKYDVEIFGWVTYGLLLLFGGGFLRFGVAFFNTVLTKVVIFPRRARFGRGSRYQKDRLDVLYEGTCLTEDRKSRDFKAI